MNILLQAIIWLVIIGGLPALIAGAVIGYRAPIALKASILVGSLGVALVLVFWSLLWLLYSVALPPIWLGMLLVGWSLASRFSPRPARQPTIPDMPPGKARRYRTRRSG